MSAGCGCCAISAGSPSRRRSVSDVFTAAATVLARDPEDLPFVLFYARVGDGGLAELVGACGVEAGAPVAPRELGASERPRWPLGASLEIFETEALTWPGPLRAGPWPEPIRQLAVVPCGFAGESPTSWLVAGISPRRRADEAYRDFLRLVGSSVEAALEVARRSEDERRRAQMLAELDRAKTTFFSNVSHEFRTPLTLIAGPIEDLLQDTDEPLGDAQRERLEIARRSTRRLQKLVNTLLDFARIEAGRAQASYVPMDLAALTADLASSFRSAAERGGARADRRLPAARRGRLRRSGDVGEDRPQPGLQRVQVHPRGEHHRPPAPPRRAARFSRSSTLGRASPRPSCLASSTAFTASRARRAGRTRGPGSASRWFRSWRGCTAAT